MFDPTGSKIQIGPLNVVPDLEVLQRGGRAITRKLPERVVIALIGDSGSVGPSAGAQPRQGSWLTVVNTQ